MDDVESLVGTARALTGEIFAHARTKLLAGADPGHTHRQVSMAIRLLEDVETYAILAASGDRDAENAIARRIHSLETVSDGLRPQGD